jgi:hypothetical protein
MDRMIAVKVVLHNSEDDELEFGPFNQGVVIENGEAIDVATSEVVAICYDRDWQTTDQVGVGAGPFDRLFIQAHGPTFEDVLDALRSDRAPDICVPWGGMNHSADYAGDELADWLEQEYREGRLGNPPSAPRKLSS